MKLNLGVILTAATALHTLYHAITGKGCIIKVEEEQKPETAETPKAE